MQSLCLLGLTATATVLIRKKVCQLLNIPDENCIVTDRVLPDNLRLTATRVVETDDRCAIIRLIVMNSHFILTVFIHRDALLLTLLKTPVFVKMNSIIIYVMYQVDDYLNAETCCNSISHNPPCSKRRGISIPNHHAQHDHTLGHNAQWILEVNNAQHLEHQTCQDPNQTRL